jgi:arsenical pump membrane protein
MTIGLVLSRPRLGRARLNPALGVLPGLALLFATGVLHAADLLRALQVLWRPLVTLASIMATTHVSHRLGIFDRVTRTIEIRTRGPVPHVFTTVFVIGAAVAAVFNNDAAILLLTPIIVPVIGRMYPRRQYLRVPFAFAVFTSAGVAPFCTSNPMNLVVAEHAGIGFNAYALRMLPVSLAGALASYAGMRMAFRKELADDVPGRGQEQGSLAPMEATPTRVLWVVVGMLLSYPVLSYLDAPVWIAALGGAVIVCLVGMRDPALTPETIVRGVAWDVLAFLFCIFLTALGLQNVGVTRAMETLYATAQGRSLQEIALVGTVSSIGSALINNHPMAMLNALAVSALPGDATWRTLAALVGGDLGPRLLPMGSLAGLLWIDTSRRLGVEIGARQFVKVGVTVAVPSLAASLLVLCAERLLFG